MMSHLPIFKITLTLILIVGVVSASTATPDNDMMYWKSVFPDTPMPTAIKTSLSSAGKQSPFRASLASCGIYNHAATQKQVNEYTKMYGEKYMVETQLTPGRVIQVRLKTHTDNKATFLTPQQSSTISIPFSSNKLPALIFNKFSIKPNSKEAAAVKETIKNCQESPNNNAGEAKLCVTSLQSMVSYVTSKLGNRVSPTSSTSVHRDGKIEYKMGGVKKVVDYGSPAVVCHKEDYPYAVFSCHQVEMTSGYEVSLVAGDGAVVKAAAVCHRDTSWWSPNHVSFQLLKNKPGEPVCHFLDDLAVIWTNK